MTDLGQCVGCGATIVTLNADFSRGITTYARLRGSRYEDLSEVPFTETCTNGHVYEYWLEKGEALSLFEELAATT